MILIDGHLDLAYNAVELHRNLSDPVAKIREVEESSPTHEEGIATVSLPDLRAADIRMACGTIFTYPASHASFRPGYRTPDEAFERANAHLDFYDCLHRQHEITLLRNRDDLDKVVSGDAPLPGICLLMEGADPIRTLRDVAYFYDRGIRIIGLAWKGTRYAGGTGEPGPLTPAGRELLREMDRFGIALDASHLAEEAFWQAMEIFPATSRHG